jgi:hypothetical protein
LLFCHHALKALLRGQAVRIAGSGVRRAIVSIITGARLLLLLLLLVTGLCSIDRPEKVVTPL